MVYTDDILGTNLFYKLILLKGKHAAITKGGEEATQVVLTDRVEKAILNLGFSPHPSDESANKC